MSDADLVRRGDVTDAFPLIPASGDEFIRTLYRIPADPVAAAAEALAAWIADPENATEYDSWDCGGGDAWVCVMCRAHTPRSGRPDPKDIPHEPTCLIAAYRAANAARAEGARP